MTKIALRALGLTALVMLAAVLIGCQSMPAATPAGPDGRENVSIGKGSYRNLSVAQLKTMLANKSFLLVDVHVPNEGHLSQTDLRLPYDKIEQNLAQLPADKDARIVLYCRSGRMSEIAAEKLVQLGYTDIWSLQGGFVAWEDAGYPLEPN